MLETTPKHLVVVHANTLSSQYPAESDVIKGILARASETLSAMKRVFLLPIWNDPTYVGHPDFDVLTKHEGVIEIPDEESLEFLFSEKRIALPIGIVLQYFRLKSILVRAGIDTVDIVGTAREWCVRDTAESLSNVKNMGPDSISNLAILTDGTPEEVKAIISTRIHTRIIESLCI